MSLSRPATVDRRGSQAPAALHPRLVELVQRVYDSPMAPGVVGYALGESTRGPETQAKYLAEGTTRAHYGESAHNWTPALAIDIYPLVQSGAKRVVSNDPAQYAPIGAAADSMGLTWGGRWTSLRDYPHVEIPGWRSMVTTVTEPARRGGGALVLALLTLSAVWWYSR